MSKWKCEICGKEFDNFHAQGFDNKIYCPLCFFKEENKQLKEVIEEVRERLEYYLIGNMKYEDSQKEFKKLLQILDKVKDQQ